MYCIVLCVVIVPHDGSQCVMTVFALMKLPTMAVLTTSVPKAYRFCSLGWFSTTYMSGRNATSYFTSCTQKYRSFGVLWRPVNYCPIICFWRCSIFLFCLGTANLMWNHPWVFIFDTELLSYFVLAPSIFGEILPDFFFL